MNRKGFAPIIVVVIIALIIFIGIGAWYANNRNTQSSALSCPPGMRGYWSASDMFSCGPATSTVTAVAASSSPMITNVSSSLPASSLGNISGWLTYTDSASGITFSYPSLGTSTIVNKTPSGYPYPNSPLQFNIAAFDPTQNAILLVVGISAVPNTSHDTLKSWFENNVDDANGTLLASGAFQFETLQHGQALIDSTPIPASYQGSPVEEGYMLSATGDTVYTITLSQESQLTDFGYSPSEQKATLVKILGSIHRGNTTAGWQTYTDPHKLFFMNWPPELQILEDSAQEGGYATYAFAVRMNKPGAIDTWSVAEIFVYTLSQWKTIQQLQTDAALPVLIAQGKNFVYAVEYSESNVDSNFNEALKSFKALQ